MFSFLVQELKSLRVERRSENPLRREAEKIVSYLPHSFRRLGLPSGVS